MYINTKTGQHMHLSIGQKLPQALERVCREVKEPQPYKGHGFFRLEERVRMK